MARAIQVHCTRITQTHALLVILVQRFFCTRITQAHVFLVILVGRMFYTRITQIHAFLISLVQRIYNYLHHNNRASCSLCYFRANFVFTKIVGKTHVLTISLYFFWCKDLFVFELLVKLCFFFLTFSVSYTGITMCF